MEFDVYDLKKKELHLLQKKRNNDRFYEPVTRRQFSFAFYGIWIQSVNQS